MLGPRFSWKKTLHLPKSTFPARALVKDRPKYLQRCTDDLYAWQRSRPTSSTFTLHDGPPYANGELHIGHALNKILKDIACRSRLPFQPVDWRPGWDCHGLPIELKALRQQGERVSSDPVKVRTAARQLAEKTVQEQKRTFRKWGIMADWDNAWTTMDKDYEVKQLEVFKEMAKKGLIYQKFRPVYWSPSSRTALAEAELEYRDDHVSTAAFVKFPLLAGSASLRNKVKLPLEMISAVIWTTTPWTLPANRAIGIHKDVEYIVAVSLDHGPLLIASSRLSEVQHHLKESLCIIALLEGADLVGSSYQSANFDTKSSTRPFLHADFVSETSGTGLVHMAPGHGMDDYEVCSEHKIMAFAPVDDEGAFTAAACPDNPPFLLGKSVLGAGNQVVLDHLSNRGVLLAQHQYTHNYPYDWRSKQPVILRATEQWFANVGDIHDNALEALDSVRFIPSGSKTRLQSFIKNRNEWCFSRQRAWGVPIPVLYHAITHEALLNEDSVTHIISIMKERGVDAWWTDEDSDPAWTPKSLRTHDGQSQYQRGRDTMDVWFDSGTSWTQTANEASVNRHVADCYLEGSDQHRGWFQSSLLTHVANRIGNPEETQAVAPFKTLITHGFTLDQDGRKMSKSIGNVVSPDEIMEGTLLPTIKKKVNGKLVDVREAMGPDALRLWAASCDFTTDIKVSQKVLQATNSSLSKLRGTFKLILGILEDYGPSSSVGLLDLRLQHEIVLWKLQTLNAKVKDLYDSFEFSKAVTEINKFVTNDLSSMYFEWIKDAAYCGTSEERLEVQGTLYEISSRLQQMLYPITPLLVEEVCDYTPQQIKDYEKVPPGQRPWPSLGWPFHHEFSLARNYMPLMEARTTIQGIQEIARNEKNLGDSLASCVCFETASTEARHLFNSYESCDLETLFGVSGFKLVSDVTHESSELRNASWSYKGQFEVSGDIVVVHLYEPTLAKCVRCWRYAAPVKTTKDEVLCERCEGLVEKLKIASPGLFE
ncbi:isoleucine-tRNA ligase [Lecanora helva]